MSRSARFRQAIQIVWRDLSGGIAVVFALVIPVLIFAIGFTVDVSRQVSAKVKLQAALDAGMLEAARAMSSGETSASNLQALAQKMAIYNLRTAGLTLTSLRLSVSNGPRKELLGTARGRIRAIFMSLIGKQTLDVVVNSNVTPLSSSYYQVVFLMDVSSSMSVGATETDVAGMQARFGCAFTCHDVNNYLTGDSRTRARELGFNAKIDYESAAVSEFIRGLQPMAAANPDTYQISIWTFGSRTTEMLDPTNDWIEADRVAQAIDLEVTLPPSQGEGNTVTSSALREIAQYITFGDGSSPTKRKTFLVLVTDGLEDTGGNGNRSLSTNYKSECSALKAKGVSIISIFTPTPTSADYGSYAPWYGQLESAMRSCASDPGSYFLAKDGAHIVDAMKGALKKVSGSIRITR